MATQPGSDLKNEDLKNEVQAFWDHDPCGTRYMDGADGFEAHARARYSLEPYIVEFAGFREARGLRVLEIGTGMGADYLEWLKAGAIATGVDLSSNSLETARRRCELAGFKSDLRVADAEHLEFADATFDIVYSYGVMHHSPDTAACLREAHRVLKPGGKLRVMVYHHPSWTGIMLWLRYGMLQGRSLRQIVFDHLESPGTKSYTLTEMESLLPGFKNIAMRVVFSPGDLLTNAPSAKFQSRFYRAVWTLYPRTLVRWFGKRWGLFLLVSATKS